MVISNGVSKCLWNAVNYIIANCTRRFFFNLPGTVQFTLSKSSKFQAYSEEFKKNQ